MSHCSTPDPRRRRWLARCLPLPLLLLGSAAAQAGAAPRRVEPFDAGTWQALRREVEARRQPLLVVFSATWCSICPEAIVRLADDPRRQRARVALVVVVTDLAPGDDDARLLAAPHYARASRLLAFDGHAAALRHAVQPGWTGTSPAVAWLAPGQATQFMQGAPDAHELQRWFARR